MIIQSFLPFTIPIGIFALSFCGIIALLFFNKKFFIKKFGGEKGLEMFYALDSSEFSKDDPDEKEVFGTKDYTSKRRKKFLRKKQKTFKIMNVVLIIIMVIFLILIALSIDHYKIIEEDGIYHSSWASIGEKYYPWEDFEHIYYEYGRILNDGETYHPYDSVIVVFILKDNARIELD
ncbi:MAG: hypothetical protein KAS76_01470 [Thermoplasmatales archaeon]|nr:hypothetical protein [Thermoplasmatales archaeon]MCK4995687.1 hypothetical protein [Thermoplasmatales archaeon]